MVFQDGQKLKAIYFADDAQICAGEVTSITVVMQLGQMAPVPWFLVTNKNGARVIHNGALVDAVVFYKEGEE